MRLLAAMMRRLHKAVPPDVLAREAAIMTADFAVARPSGVAAPTPWRHSDIVSALIAETHGKCAYCEVVIADVAAPHVEHILPKSVRPDLVVEWQNLTLACPACNTAKGTYYSLASPLLSPYVHEPTAHLHFAGPAVTARPGDDLGRRTVTKLKLMRAPLLIERAKRIQQCADLLDRWARAVDPDEKVIFEEEVHAFVQEDAEFAGVLRAFVSGAGFPMTSPSSACTGGACP